MRRLSSLSPKNGFSQMRLLIVLAAFCVIGAGVFLKLRHNTLMAIDLKKQERIQQLDLELQEDIQKLLGQTEAAIKNKELETAKKLLQKIKVMDLDARFSEEMSVLILQSKTLEKEIKLKAKREGVVEVFQSSLTQREFASAKAALKQLKSLQEPNLAELQSRYDTLLKKSEAEKNIYAKVRDLSNNWQIKRAIALMQSIQHPMYSSDFETLTEQLNKKTSIAEKLVSLFVRIEDLDKGEFSSEAEKLIVDGLKLAPKHPELLRWQKKFLSYPQIVRVPIDVASIDEALPQLRDGGEIHLGEGVFYAEIKFTKGVTLVGIDREKTIIESRALRQAGFLFDHPEKTSSVSNLTIRGVADSVGEYPLVQLSQGSLTMSNVLVDRAPSSGIASSGKSFVGSQITVSNTKDSAYVATHGHSKLTSSEFSMSGAHGVEVFQNAALALIKCNVHHNAQAGVVATVENPREVKILGCRIAENRECGVYLSGETILRAHKTQILRNGFSGLVAKGEVRFNFVEALKSSKNGEYGYLLGSEVELNQMSRYFQGEGNKLGLIVRKKNLR